MDNHQLNGKKPEDFIDLSDYQQPTCTKDQVSEVIKRLYGQKFTAHQICNILVKLYYRADRDWETERSIKSSGFLPFNW